MKKPIVTLIASLFAVSALAAPATKTASAAAKHPAVSLPKNILAQPVKLTPVPTKAPHAGSTSHSEQTSVKMTYRSIAIEGPASSSSGNADSWNTSP